MSQDILCIVRLSLTSGSCGPGGLGSCGPGAGGQGFSPDIMGMTAGYIHEKEEEELLDLRTWNCWIFRGEYQSNREKPVPLRAMNRVNDKPNPHMMSPPVYKPEPQQS